MTGSPGRRRRADAERSRAAIIDAAIDLLGRRPAASMEEIAAAAGVARQTVYAHYSSREALLGAIVERITGETVAALNAIDPGGPAIEALREWLTVSWEVVGRYRMLLTVPLPAGDAAGEHDRHLPIMERLTEIVGRGQATGEFTTGHPAGWLVAATISLGHTAGQEVAAGRMTPEQAGAAYRESVLRLAVR
ncbi:TetR/AcrR family transcriptional regulator [Actinoplanes aureus]|uniref:TetR/AcrR family transcriptional regulator n=1 Tax=Actinoplanes aureus TaxID=2792083 RepID=A0A931C5P3_9ACTN|nr:TetR/AcrR family transcriptional regulator [Actinoplanes aureus]MBG0562699.1 TetR/AcrR family transcriptional regulator [Actinoplanes aureus]